jgi:hypothetical protein
MMTDERRLMVLAVCMLSAACGLIAGVEDVPIGVDGGTADGAPGAESGRHADGGGRDGGTEHDATTDGGGHATKDGGTDVKSDARTDGTMSVPETGGKVDASDAAPLADGYIQCARTSASCNGAGGQECCINLSGEFGDASASFNTAQTSCEVVGGPNCGFFASEGPDFQEAFPQTCSGPEDCTAGDVCCAEVSDGGAGAPPMIASIACTSGMQCATLGVILCGSSPDCPSAIGSGICVNETDPLLSHLFPRYCMP